MKRDFLFAYYQTPRGKLLQSLEADYLKRSITVSCQQTVLQIGGLNWEHEFIDCTLYQHYAILDAKYIGVKEAKKIQGKSYALPIKTNSIDLVIIPHLLEFDASRFQTIREVERVLTPEGILIILNFNPWSFWVRYQFLWDKKLSHSWLGSFISRSRVFDWLKVLNFEIFSCTEFLLDTTKTKSGSNATKSFSFLSSGYAIKAVKRRYNPINLTPVKKFKSELAMANTSILVEKNQSKT